MGRLLGSVPAPAPPLRPTETPSGQAPGASRRGRPNNSWKFPTFAHDELPERLKRLPEQQRDPPPLFLYGIPCNKATLVRYAEKNDIVVREGMQFLEVTIRDIRNHMQRAFGSPFVRIEPLNPGPHWEHLYGVGAYNNHLFNTAPPCLERNKGPTIGEVMARIQLALEIFDEALWYAQYEVLWKEIVHLI